MDPDAQSNSVSPAPDSSKNARKNNLIKRTSFTIPSMSGFWPHPDPQAPTVPELPQVVPVQEEDSPPPPMPVRRPDWGWPTVEGARATDEQASVELAARMARETAQTRLLFTAILLVLLFAVLASGTFIYISSRAATLNPAPVAVHHGTHTVSASVNPSPASSPVNGRFNGSSPGTNAGTSTRSFRVGAHPLIVIKGHGSNVSIHVGNMSTVVVTAKQQGGSNDTGVLYTQANDGQGHDRIGIATNPGYMNVDYDVTAPQTALVEVQVDSGSVTVDGVSGATINSGGGNLDIEDVSGPVNVYTENGDITAYALTGSMQMEVGNGGSIRVNNINGTLNAISHNGDIVVREAALSGSSLLETNYGSVSFDGSMDVQGTYTLKTINGNINLALPDNAAFQLEASTGSGSVYNAFGGAIVGYAPRAQIIGSIENGSMTVNRAV